MVGLLPLKKCERYHNVVLSWRAGRPETLSLKRAETRGGRRVSDSLQTVHNRLSHSVRGTNVLGPKKPGDRENDL